MCEDDEDGLRRVGGAILAEVDQTLDEGFGVLL